MTAQEPPGDLELARRRRKSRGPGRPSKLTLEVKAIIVQTIQGGNFFQTACEYAHVEPATAYRWIRRGEGRDPDHEPGEPYESFAREVRHARAFAEMVHVAVITRAAMEHWQASAWWLERAYPEKWGRQERVTAEIDIKGATEHVLPPTRSAERLIELVQLARELGIVEAEAVEDAEIVEE